MASLKKKALRVALGTSDAARAGRLRLLEGLRYGDRRQLYLGLALSAVAYLQRTKPRKILIHRQTLPEGTALVIHHTRSGTPRLEIVKPRRRSRG